MTKDTTQIVDTTTAQGRSILPGRSSETWENFLLVQSRLCYENWLLPPGQKLKVVPGLYLEYHVVALQVSTILHATQPKIRILLPGRTGGKDRLAKDRGIELTRDMGFEEICKQFNRHRTLHAASAVIRSELNLAGGSGIAVGSIKGWADYQSMPLNGQDVLNIFDPSNKRYTTADGETNEESYVWRLVEDLDKQTMVSDQEVEEELCGASYHIGGSTHLLPNFIYLPMADYVKKNHAARDNTTNSWAVPEVDRLKLSLRRKLGRDDLYVSQQGFCLDEVVDPRMTEGIVDTNYHEIDKNKYIMSSGRLLKKEAATWLYPKLTLMRAGRGIYELDMFAARRALTLSEGTTIL
jgi:hypothetical protein